MNDILSEIKTLLEAALGAKFKTYYIGPVKLPPKSYLPALIIQPLTTNVASKSTGEDIYTHNIRIMAVVDMADFFDEAGTGTAIKSIQELINMMEERDAATQIPKSDTILGTLRKDVNVRGTKYLFNDNVDMNYDYEFRGTFFYVRAQMDVTFTNITKRLT